jgi:hypothetical protein
MYIIISIGITIRKLAGIPVILQATTQSLELLHLVLLEALRLGLQTSIICGVLTGTGPGLFT